MGGWVVWDGIGIGIYEMDRGGLLPAAPAGWGKKRTCFFLYFDHGVIEPVYVVPRLIRVTPTNWSQNTSIYPQKIYSDCSSCLSFFNFTKS